MNPTLQAARDQFWDANAKANAADDEGAVAAWSDVSLEALEALNATPAQCLEDVLLKLEMHLEHEGPLGEAAELVEQVISDLKSLTDRAGKPLLHPYPIRDRSAA